LTRIITLIAIATEAALRYCTKARLLGGRFMQVNPMTERVEYLHLTSHTAEIFRKSWTQMTSRMAEESSTKTTAAKKVVVVVILVVIVFVILKVIRNSNK
jgi:hypothetical protein